MYINFVFTNINDTQLGIWKIAVDQLEVKVQNQLLLLSVRFSSLRRLNDVGTSGCHLNLARGAGSDNWRRFDLRYGSALCETTRTVG